VTQQNAKPLVSPPLSDTFRHRQTMSNAMRFTTTELVEIEGRIASQDEGEGTVRVHCDALGTEILARHSDPIPVGTPVAVSVRPEKIDVHETRPEADNVAMGRVAEIAYLGDVSIYQVKTPAGAVIRVQETHIVRSSEPHYDWDDTLYLSWEAGSAVVLPT